MVSVVLFDIKMSREIQNIEKSKTLCSFEMQFFEESLQKNNAKDPTLRWSALCTLCTFNTNL